MTIFIIGFCSIICLVIGFSSINCFIVSGSSIICSIIAGSGSAGELWVGGTTAASKAIREWCFCLAFVSIGLSTNFGELAKTLKGGKPIVLYVCGQSLNLVLTLFMAWLMYEKVFPQN